jgi:H+/Cl- antiporter ClcA
VKTELGRVLIYLGLIIVVFGVAILLAGKIPWLGNLPGDISIQRGRFTIYFPLGTCLLVSALISLVVYFFRR